MSNYIRRTNRKRYSRLTKELKQYILTAYESGHSGNWIASDIGYEPSTVYRVLKQSGVAIRPTALSHQKHFTAIEEQNILDLWKNGVPGLTISGRLGCSRQRVYRVLRKHGVEYKPRSRRGELHHGWKGGRNVNNNGYMCVVLPDDHPFVSMRQGSSRHVLEHRLVMAEYLGRPLLNHESVHHIDGDKLHNAIENLQLRIGPHGTGMPYRCLDCGSDRISPAELKEATL
jgi:hypothetical protein